jgi:hypothetical protein
MTFAYIYTIYFDHIQQQLQHSFKSIGILHTGLRMQGQLTNLNSETLLQDHLHFKTEDKTPCHSETAPH